MAFKYEKELPHQEAAINAVIKVLRGQRHLDKSSYYEKDRLYKLKFEQLNTLEIDNKTFIENISKVQEQNYTADTGQSAKTEKHKIVDISMETGTGKTYTYAKTMYELNREYGLFKFVIVVPTLSIKAGTKNFLDSKALFDHFRGDFEGKYENTKIKLYVVESQKQKKSKSYLLKEVDDFVNADNAKEIHVLLINQGMINSPSLAGTTSDRSNSYGNIYDTPVEAIAATRPVIIIDEPHKFDKANTTWGNIEKLNPLLTLRYGATFTSYENLIYRLTAVQAFNDNLVKGVNVFVETIEGYDGSLVRLESAKKEQAIFSIGDKSITVKQGDSLASIHPNFRDIVLEGSKTNEVRLSNGLTRKKGETLNPFSYSDSLSDKMLRNAIKVHFDTEEELLNREQRIKPLTLFFIDDIKGYREGRGVEGSLLTKFELFLQDEVKKRLDKAKKNSNNINPDYVEYLEKTLADVSATHGGYFAKDNSDSDEKIEQEIQEILHDKEKLLDLNNPRRFIFSKWTLREGWDNPNVFGICKLRSSGSEISKLQEVGRGLRLPVNEHMARVKDEDFYLNYFVDSSEQDFVQSLVNEVNSRSGITGTDQDSREFENKHRIKNANQAQKRKVRMRTGKYDELKSLWETLNQKVILQYEIESENDFLELVQNFLKHECKMGSFIQTSKTTKSTIEVEGDRVVDSINTDNGLDNKFEPIAQMSYDKFLLNLSESMFIQRNTLHKAFLSIVDEVDIRNFLNQSTIDNLKSRFNEWLLHNSFDEFSVGYATVNNKVHPTKFTDKQGNPYKELDASIFDGEIDENSKALEQFLFDTVFFNSELERQNQISGRIKEVVVFTKIPKNSIRIPVAGGKTYSPDFAYVVKTGSEEFLNFIIETKGVDDKEDLRQEEKKKIEHANKLFARISQQTKVIFNTQFNKDKISDIIKSAIENNVS